MQSEKWLKKLNMEVQEHEDGLWIELHLNETIEDNQEDLSESEEE